MSEKSLSTADQLQSKALWLALITIVVWGTNFSVQKAVFSALTPPGFLLVRYLIMPVCAIVLLLVRYRLSWPGVSRSDLFGLLRLGIAGHLLHVGLVTYGINLSTAFSSSLILSCTPVYTLLILHWMGIERFSARQVSAVAVALLGVLVFLSDKLLSGRWQASGGDLILLVAASLWSYYTVASKPLIEKLGAVVVMAYATLLGSVPVLLVAWPAASNISWAQVQPAIWLGVAYAVVISAFLGWLVWGWINSVRGVARTAPLQYLMPPIAGLVAWVIGGEQFTIVKLTGAAITLSGVAWAQLSSPAVRETPPPVD